MRGKREHRPVVDILIGLVTGLAAAALICMIGSLLIHNRMLDQKWDFAAAAVALVVWLVTSYWVIQKRAKLKKWFTAVTTGGGILVLLLLGNLLMVDPDLSLLPGHVLMIVCSVAIILLLGSGKKKNYRMRY